ncbi:fimbria/pilus outer membrane usher protein [Serratia sp. CY54781]|uniref:fimbria/pilus outer membrane usher protein n=2 Tax=Serratia TaxID=613 RepID=UPI0010206278|nr:fimbria/pilus outer membrane usher protein [Serratia marcescens]RZA57731.1 fimbrial biogenesis outer membrane usher protein [Serratia marcescens]
MRLRWLAVLLSCAVFKGISAETHTAFDVKTLMGRGYSSDIAGFFDRARFLPGVHAVTIEVNAAQTYEADMQFGQEGQPCMDESLLTMMKLYRRELPASCVALESLWPEATVNVEPGRFRVLLTVPERAFDPDLASNEQRGGYAALLNYDLFGQQFRSGYSQQTSLMGTFEPGINVGNWVIRNRSQFSRDGYSNRVEYQETAAWRSIESWSSVLQLGEFGTRGSLYSGLPLLGGQLFTDEGQATSGHWLLPIQGVAQSNATVEIRQRGRTVYRTLVPPGPFSLNSGGTVMPGAEATVEITEENGQKQSFPVNIPATGAGGEHGSYQLGIGRYRRYQAEPPPSGIPLLLLGEKTWTVGQRRQATFGGLLASNYQNLALRGDIFEGEKGSLSASALSSNGRQRRGGQLEGQGQIQLGERLSLSFFSLYRTEKYQDPDEALSSASLGGRDSSSRLRSASGLAISIFVPELGAFSYSLSQNRYYRGQSSLMHIVGVTRSFERATLSANLQSSVNEPAALYVSLSLPLGSGSLSNRFQRSKSNRSAFGIQYQNGGSENFDYTLDTSAADQERSVGGSLNLKTAYARLAAGASRTNQGNSAFNLSSSGAVAYANGVLATSPQWIGDSLAVVSLPRQSGVPVTVSGGSGGITDFSGDALLPVIEPYMDIQANVNTQKLPLNVRLDSTHTAFRVARGSVVKRQFKVTEVRQLLLTVRTASGGSLPQGAAVYDEAGGFMGTLIGDGNVMLVNADIGKKLRLRVPNQPECTLSYRVPEVFDPEALYEAEDAVCR